jgi:phosphotransferase system enzyme I (PtsI)
VTGDSKKSITLNGTGVSPGIATGKAEVYHNELEDMAAYPIDPGAVEDEVARYTAALDAVRSHLAESAVLVSEKIGPSEAGIFDAQIEILSGTLFTKTIPRAVRQKLTNVEAVLLKSLRDLQRTLRSEGTKGIGEKLTDIGDLHRQIVHLLIKKNPQCIILYDTVILTAREFLLSDMTLFPLDRVIGLVSETGGTNSHTAIMARSLAIPAVMGVPGAGHVIKNGDFLIVDGSSGEVLINPDPDVRAAYEKKIEEERVAQRRMEALIDLPTRTVDGTPVALFANISGPQDLSQAKRYGAAGVGLFRTELPFLMGEHFIAEDEQFSLYRQVITEMEGRPVTIRTLDLGGDKILPQDVFAREANPFLGLRSIRFSLRYRDIFVTQLRAILRASAFGSVRLLFPMVSSQDELTQIVDIYRRVRRDLEAEGVRPAVEPSLGIMIEVPSAALMAESFLAEFDFASIGTNDLIQYTLAVDRGNRWVSDLYSPYDPAVLRLIAMTADAGKKLKKEVNVCGEMASDPASVVLLIGMGMTVLSMESRHLLKIKQTVNSIDRAEAEKAARRALSMKSAREVKEFITGAFDLPKGD